MNTDGKPNQLNQMMGQIGMGTTSQEAGVYFQLDEALLEALREIAGLGQALHASERTSMRCSTCRIITHERCSYCLSPVCLEHGDFVRIWWTSRRVIVCSTCQPIVEELNASY